MDLDDDEAGESKSPLASPRAPAVDSVEDEVGPPVSLTRRGNPARGWPSVWNDAWDDAINTKLTLDDVIRGAVVEVWYRGYWWWATIWAKARSLGTVSVRWQHSGTITSGYRITLVRRPQLQGG